jgi:hypothetical protein
MEMAEAYCEQADGSDYDAECEELSERMMSENDM